MNIAIFASAFYPHVGGVEELCRQVAHAFMQAGHNVIVLTNRWPRSLPDQEEYEGIPLYRLPFRVPEGSLKARVNYRLTHCMIRRRMLQILRQHEIDLLHVQCVSSNGYYALLAKQTLGVPLVVTAQGERTMDAGGLYQKSVFANSVLRELLARADHVTACSRNTLDDIVQYFGEPLGDRASVVYNGISLADFQNVAPYGHSKPYILGIGRLVPQKGFDLLIRAFAASHVESHDLLIAGEGLEREGLQCLIGDLGVGDRVRLIGRADRQLAVSLFTGCSFFVLPSRLEPMGIVNLEAMAAGKAVIASRVGGVPEIVRDGDTGLLVPPENVSALAAALHQICTTPDFRQRLGAQGQERAANFDWPRIAKQYLAIYQRLLSPIQQTAPELAHEVEHVH